jgi:ABC-type branched-subunit amino acid transport system substrate-binding protein
MRKKRSLIITPFDSAGKEVHNVVSDALESIGVEVFKFDDIAAGASWANAVTDAIRSADFLVADLTGSNANVFYELGLAHAMRKPTILIASSEAKMALPSDLAGLPYFVYEPGIPRRLAFEVQRAARWYVEKGEERK